MRTIQDSFAPENFQCLITLSQFRVTKDPAKDPTLQPPKTPVTRLWQENNYVFLQGLSNVKS